ncbi:MAG: 30S ribosomal protein S8 [Deltaproteobacteria bacterium]|nr:MAG: 30S ribosomal protein S8 [Deltaproteobacteria bacterium]PIE75275.1 MAG: 30S ribosomal protein S8 [Deltaproteobacteria bacterium]
MSAITDPIADLLTRIRNAGNAKLESVDIPNSVIKTNIARILKDQGFVKDYKIIEDSKQGILRVYLKFMESGKHVIFGIERVSKPSRRVYSKASEIAKVRNGLGIAILSTSKGLMTDKEARKINVGGEILCNVW